MKLQNYFQDPSSLHIGTEPLRAYYVPCKEEAEANDADMLNASRAIVLNGDDWKFKSPGSGRMHRKNCRSYRLRYHSGSKLLADSWV